MEEAFRPPPEVAEGEFMIVFEIKKQDISRRAPSRGREP
jgi:hypothetical protein